jgi:hypothetical protein
MSPRTLWQKLSSFLVFWLFLPPLFDFAETTLETVLPELQKYQSIYFRTHLLLGDGGSIAIYSAFDYYVFGIFEFVWAMPVWYLIALVPAALIFAGIEIAARYGTGCQSISAIILGALVADAVLWLASLISSSDGSAVVDTQLSRVFGWSGAFSSIGALSMLRLLRRAHPREADDQATT